MNVLNVVLLILGFVLLIKGSDVFVDASAGIAKNLKVPNLVVGLTIVAFGTSAPEAVIGISAAINGSSELAVGNSIGADIFNLVFIIGFCALVRPMYINFKEIARDYWIALMGPILLFAMMVFFEDSIPRFGAALLLTIFFIYVVIVVKGALKNRVLEEADEEDPAPHSLKRNLLFGVLGLALIIGGGELTVHHAVDIATTIGISERVVGLTIIAIGTSLPELIISFTAARRGENSLAIGNIIGSSIFNIMFVLGISGMILPLAIDTGLMFDIAALLFGSSVFLVFVLTKKRIARYEGLIMVFLYVSYLTYVVLS